MPRRKTTIGKGAFGNPVPVELHAWEVLQRIRDKGQPLTEDAVFLSMYDQAQSDVVTNLSLDVILAILVSRLYLLRALLGLRRWWCLACLELANHNGSWAYQPGRS